MKIAIFIAFGPLFLFGALALFSYVIENERLKDIAMNLLTCQMILIALAIVITLGMVAFQ